MNPLLNLALIALALLPTTAQTTELIGKILAPPKAGKPALQLPYHDVSLPAKTGAPIPLQLSAASWYAVDVESGQPLANQHADSPRAIASITKLATALVIVRDHKLNETITIPKLPDYQPEDEIIGLKQGQKLTIEELLAAILIHSANDAADALAIADSGSRESFANKMNEVMSDWGIANARFSNPSGLNDTDNAVSPRALATIGQLALHNATIARLVKTQSSTIQADSGERFALTATDRLLQNGRFQGIKTGYTKAAGECFIGLTTIEGHQVITVVLGSQDRFGDTLKLADWIAQSYQWQ